MYTYIHTGIVPRYPSYLVVILGYYVRVQVCRGISAPNRVPGDANDQDDNGHALINIVGDHNGTACWRPRLRGADKFVTVTTTAQRILRALRGACAVASRRVARGGDHQR